MADGLHHTALPQGKEPRKGKESKDDAFGYHSNVSKKKYSATITYNPMNRKGAVDKKSVTMNPWGQSDSGSAPP